MGFRLLRRAHAFFVCEWPNERAAEIVAYAHGGVGLAVAGALAWFASLPALWSLGGGALTFLVLTAFVFNRYTVWLAALLGSGMAAATVGCLGWFVGHGAEWVHGPVLGTIVGGLLGAGVAIPAYVSFIRGSRQTRTSLTPTSS